MCERAVKRLSYASFQYAPDQYKTQQMCESVSLKDQENLRLVSNQEMCERTVKRFSYEFWYVSDQYKTQ